MFEWEDPCKSCYALLTFSLAVTYLEVWHLPLLPFLLITFHLYRARPPHLPGLLEEEEALGAEDGDKDATKDEAKGEDWKISTRIKEVTQKALWMQEVLGQAADRAESLQNLFLCTVPFISCVAGCLLLLLMALLYFLPVR